MSHSSPATPALPSLLRLCHLWDSFLTAPVPRCADGLAGPTSAGRRIHDKTTCAVTIVNLEDHVNLAGASAGLPPDRPEGAVPASFRRG